MALSDLANARIDIARLETELGHLSATISELKSSNTSMAIKLDDVLRQLAEAKGGWRTLMWLGGASASAGSLITWGLQHFKFSS